MSARHETASQSDYNWSVAEKELAVLLITHAMTGSTYEQLDPRKHDDPTVQSIYSRKDHDDIVSAMEGWFDGAYLPCADGSIVGQAWSVPTQHVRAETNKPPQYMFCSKVPPQGNKFGLNDGRRMMRDYIHQERLAAKDSKVVMDNQA